MLGYEPNRHLVHWPSNKIELQLVCHTWSTSYMTIVLIEFRAVLLVDDWMRWAPGAKFSKSWHFPFHASHPIHESSDAKTTVHRVSGPLSGLVCDLLTKETIILSMGLFAALKTWLRPNWLDAVALSICFGKRHNEMGRHWRWRGHMTVLLFNNICVLLGGELVERVYQN